MLEALPWLVFDVSFKILSILSLIFLYWKYKTTVGGSATSAKTLPEKPKLRKIHLLEEISRDVGQVNHSFAKYSALAIESTRFGKRWPSARQLELDKINNQLVNEFDKLAQTEAKLLMLGEKTMEKTLRLYASRIALFRKQVYVGRQDISEQEIADLKESILKLREHFYDILSRRYDKLMASR